MKVNIIFAKNEERSLVRGELLVRVWEVVSESNRGVIGSLVD